MTNKGRRHKTITENRNNSIVAGLLTLAGAVLTLVVTTIVGFVSEERRSQETKLQTYLDDIGEMILDANADYALIRAKTMAILPELNNPRKAQVLQFLLDSGFIYIEGEAPKKDEVSCYLPLRYADDSEDQTPYEAQAPVDLHGADLRTIDFKGSNLQGVDLSRTYLSDANLEGSTLKGINLFYTGLQRANLSNRAYLGEANLACAALQHASFRDSNLFNADLRRTNLFGTDLTYADLRCANLEGAKNITQAYLADATYDSKTTWPEDFDPKAAGAKFVENPPPPECQEEEDTQ